MTLAILLATLFAPSDHAGAAVSSEMVCSVQRAVSLQPTWPEGECQRVAAALNDTPRPRTTAAMVTLESDWRPDVAVEARPGVFDVGLLGVRCVVRPGFTARDTGSRSAEILTTTQTQTDGMPAGRCENGLARGHTLVTLADPVTNIRVAAEIMAEKRARFGKAWAFRYNGATHENGYTRKVRVVEAALGGVRLATKCKRVRRLVELILAAMKPRIAMEN
jgi:hypothetical protein